MAIIATGAKTIIDLSDGKVLSIYLGSNLPRTQIYDVNATTYSIDWTSSPYLIITPVIYINQTAVGLTDSALTVMEWKRKEGIGSPPGTLADLIANETVTNNVLTVTANKLSGVASKLLTYSLRAVYHDPETGLDVEAFADISFALITSGTNAHTVYLSGEQVFKYTSGNPTPSPTSITVTATLTPATLTITKWEYLSASPNTWTTIAGTATSINVGYNTAGYWTDNPNVCRIKCTADGGLISDTFTLVKVADGVNPITGYLTNESVVVAAAVDGTGYSLTSAGGTFKIYEGATDRTTSSTFGITGGTDTGATWTKTQNGLLFTLNETTGAYTLSGTWTTDAETFTLTGVYGGVTVTKVYTISKSKVGGTGGAGPAGTPASTINIAASAEVFKSINGGTTYTPTNIVLTPVFQTVTGGSWQYSIDGGTNWVTVVTATHGHTIAGDVLTIAATSDLYTSSVTSITYKKLTSGTVTDQVTIPKVVDGLHGITVTLSNEAHTMPKTSAGVITYTGSGTTIRVFEGATELNYVPGTTANGEWKVVATPTNITTGTLTDSGAYLTVGVHSAMTADTASISYAITGKRATGGAISLTVLQTFSMANQGVPAVTFSLYAPFGTIFENHTGTDKTIAISAYNGSTAITSPTSYAWYKYAAGSWGSAIGTASTLTVTAASVIGTATFKCDMEYNGVTYTDMITFIDKTDNYQAVIESTAGDVFKNTVGNTVLSCRIWQNGVEVDPLKLDGTAVVYATTDPVAGLVSGDFYYKIIASQPGMTLRKYTTVWADATGGDLHTRTYTWYRRDKDGVAMDGGAAFATGKTIYVDQDDVTVKTVFTCEVS